MAEPNTDPDLVAALIEGVFETPLWSSFLDLLRKRTKSDYVILIFQPRGRPFEDALHLIAGGPPMASLDFHKKHFHPADPPLPMLPEGKPYSLAELFSGADDTEMEFYHQLVGAHGVTAVRNMRVRENTGVDAWLTIARHGKDFTSRDTALLSGIAPVLRGVLRNYIAVERERFAASLTADAVRRLQFGWLSLDRSGLVLDTDERGALVLSDSGVMGRAASGRLTAKPAKIEREIFHALARMADDPDSRPRAFTLSRDPWLDMLLVPARSKPISAIGKPAAIAYVHGDSWRSADRCEQLAELFALSPSESRLALALSRGFNIAEAAAEFGLTVETARNYSKIIYAKTGARGMPDLVRIVMRSVLAIAPDA